MHCRHGSRFNNLKRENGQTGTLMLVQTDTFYDYKTTLSCLHTQQLLKPGIF